MKISKIMKSRKCWNRGTVVPERPTGRPQGSPGPTKEAQSDPSEASEITRRLKKRFRNNRTQLEWKNSMKNQGSVEIIKKHSMFWTPMTKKAKKTQWKTSVTRPNGSPKGHQPSPTIGQKPKKHDVFLRIRKKQQKYEKWTMLKS